MGTVPLAKLARFDLVTKVDFEPVAVYPERGQVVEVERVACGDRSLGGSFYTVRTSNSITRHAIYPLFSPHFNRFCSDRS